MSLNCYIGLQHSFIKPRNSSARYSISSISSDVHNVLVSVIINVELENKFNNNHNFI